MTRSARKTSFQLPTLHGEGNLLPDDLLQRIAAHDPRVPGLSPDAYHLNPGETLREVISRAWLTVQAIWTSFQARLAAVPTDDPATTLTRDRWLLPLLKELDYGRLVTTKPITVGDCTFPVSHTYQHSPIHLLGWRVDLDHRTEKIAGAARAAPHSLVQDLLNRSKDHQWALVSNGRTLRVLRDNLSLVRQAYLEFDLETMMTGEHFADFALLWLVCHQSRIEAAKPDECWLEKWFEHARDEGVRALHRLRGGVQQAIERLGRGFLHPRNEALRDALRTGTLTTQDYYRELLRLAYRLIFLFVAEDRDLLLDPDAPETTRERYTRHYATTRLRRLAERRRGGPHGDLWLGLRLVLGKLYAGCPELGLPALGSYLWSTRATPHLDQAELPNEDLLAALLALGRVEDDRGVSYPVNWKNLAAAELGSVYEALLELHPELHIEARTFDLRTAAGNERKTSGSYYTPEDLVNRLLQSALTPVLEAATTGKPREAAISALLDLKVCDPACGSGHFLVAAAHRMAHRLAALRTGEDEPAPKARQSALREVVGRCIFGVDINPMAVELCKVSLWMEALDPGKPLSFLEAHVQCGNSLLGATPALLARGIPEKAFAGKLEGDDNEVARALRKRDRDERKGERANLDLFAAQAPAAAPTNTDAARLREHALMVDAADDKSLTGVESKDSRYASWQASPEQRRAEFLADLWCATLVWRTTADFAAAAPTTAEWLHLVRKPADAKPATLAALAEIKQQYRFFHWHLRFPQVFAPSTAKPELDDPCGWNGGFDVILGNPPWERVKLQEKEFFAECAPDVAAADNAAQRKRLMADLPRSRPDVWRAWLAAVRASEGEAVLLRDSGHFPLCGRGDVNTYSIFAEINLQLLANRGRAGFIVPTGLATDATTSDFIAHLVDRAGLASLVSFENFGTTFAAVNNRQSFCLVTLSAAAVAAMAFQFNVHQPDRKEDLGPTEYTLEPADFRLLNPNTRTCPTFRTKRDADIVRGIYRRVPVLWREGAADGNPWNLSFRAMLHMANDSGLFKTRAELELAGWRLQGAIFTRGDEQMLPLYEAKMVQHYDHRFASLIEGDPGNRPSRKFEGWYGADTQNPEEFVTPRYWVAASEVAERMESRWSRGWLIGWRDICRSTDSRTLISSLVPISACGDKFLLALTTTTPSCFYTMLCSFVVDYCTRQKLGGTSLKYYTFKQLPILSPESFRSPCLWSTKDTVATWILPRVLELTYTAWDLEHFARDMGHEDPPFRWNDARRPLLRAELDAAFFHLYGLPRDDVAWILDTFWVVRQKDQKAHGEYRTRRLILERYDAMAHAIATGTPYPTALDPPPAHPSLTHPPRPAGATTWPLPPQPREVIADFTATVDELAEPATSKPAKPRKRSEPAPDQGFQLKNPPNTPQLGLTFADPPSPPQPAVPGFRLKAESPQVGLGLASTPKPAIPAPPPPTASPAPTEPPLLRSLREGGGWSARPDVLAIVRALLDATSPRSRDEILAAAAVDVKSWPSIIKLLVDNGLVTTQGKARATRYLLANPPTAV
ncbi:MAG: N-6 DNA methylase [Myxococcales bacterium]|nr:N-6 DNA methylase [Myxococcales bacterium]